MTLEADGHRRVEIGLCHGRFERAHLIVDQQTFGDIGLNGNDAAAIGAVQVTCLLRWLEAHEVADRHLSLAGRHTEPFELLQIALGEGETQTDVDLLIGIIGPELCDFDAVGQHGDGIAKYGDISAVAGRLLPVDFEPPLDPGQRPAILRVNEAADLLHHQTQLLHGRGHLFRVAGGHLQLHRLAGRRATLLLAHFQDHAWNIVGELANLL